MTTPLISTNAPSAILILRDTKGRRCAKAFTKDGVESYPRVLRWHPKAVELDGFEHMARALPAAAKLGDAIVIRGAMPDGVPVPAEGVYRRMVGSGLPDAVWTPAARRWLALDCDGVEGTDPLNPWGELRAMLPRFLAGCSFVGQLTSSAGIAPGIRARLWFWLDQPVSDGQLRAFPWPVALRVDTSIFNAVQPHYIAAPSFTGVAGPDCVRWQVIPGLDGDTACADELMLAPPQPALAALPAYALPACNDAEIEMRIAKIRASSTTGSRHFHALGAACELIAVGCPPELVELEVDDLIRRQGREPTATEAAGIVRSAIEKQIAGTMVLKTPPVAAVLDHHDAAAPAEDAETGAEVDGDDIVGESPAGMSMYGANDWLNAGMYRREVYPDGGFIRWGQQDWEWTGKHWVALENEEVLLARIQNHTGLKGNRAGATTRSFRSLMSRERLKPPCMLDGEPLSNVLAFANGVLDINDWLLDPNAALLQPDPNRFITCSLSYPYDPAAKAPRFEAFLRSIWPTQDDQRREFQKMLGYLLLHDNRFHKMFVMLGAPRSGKGTILRVINALVGKDNCCAPNLSSLANDFGLHVLLGRSVATIGEANAQGHIPDTAIDRIKSISGGDQVPVNRKGKDELHLHLPVRFVFACNRLPGFLDPSGALAARMVLFTMHNSFAGKEDFDLGRSLEAELPGIAIFALEGLRMLLVDDGRFVSAESTRRAAAEFRAMQAPTPTFLAECVEPGDADDWLPLRQFYAVYKAWCAEHGHKPTAEARLSAELSHAFPAAADLSTIRKVGTGATRSRQRSHFRLTVEGEAMLQQAAATGFDDARE